MMKKKGESDASDKHQGQSGQCEVGTIGKGAFPFLFSKKKKEQRGKAAEDAACRRYEDKGVGAQPEAQAGHEFDVPAAQGAAGQNAQEQEHHSASCRRQGVVCEEGGVNSGESHAPQSQGNHHAVEKAVLLKVCHCHQDEQGRQEKEKEERKAGGHEKKSDAAGQKQDAQHIRPPPAPPFHVIRESQNLSVFPIKPLYPARAKERKGQGQRRH